MFEYIDIYCERLEPGFWAEPVNAATNISFFLATLFAFRLASKENAINFQTSLLMFLLFCIGVGSFLFHTLAVGWAQLADVLPILLYQIAFLTLYSRCVMELSFVKTGALLAAFFATIYGFGQLPSEWLNGSLSYGPPLLFILGLGLWHYLNKKRERFLLLLAGGVFIVSLTFRSVDMALCDQIPLGTHFQWHVLNGVVLYLTTHSFIVNQSK